jgi:hypothetical protein
VDGRTILSRIQAGLFLLCSVTYVVSLVYFAAILPSMIFTQVDHQGKPTLYMEKGFFMALYTALLLPVFLIQFYERIPSPRIIRKLCRTINGQASRLGPFNNPRVWKWMALGAYGFLLYIFLTICVSNYKQMGT